MYFIENVCTFYFGQLSLTRGVTLVSDPWSEESEYWSLSELFKLNFSARYCLKVANEKPELLEEAPSSSS